MSLAPLPLLLAPALLVACGDRLGPNDPAAIVITPEAPRLVIGQTLQLTAAVVDASGREIPGLDVDFESSLYTIVAVSETGLLTSFGEGGSSTITATHGDLRAQVTATVVLPPSTLYVSPASLELDSGEELQLFARVTDENSEDVTTAEFAFRSDDPTVATVDEASVTSGQATSRVTARAPGTTTIVVTSGERETRVPVRVLQVASRAVLTPLSVVLPRGGVQQLRAAVLDRTGDEIAGKAFTWTSSDEAVVTVSQAGEVRSVGPEGSAIVTATTEGFSVSRGVFVGTPPDPALLARVPLSAAYGVSWDPGGTRYFATSYSFGMVSGTAADLDSPASVGITGGYVYDVAADAPGGPAYVAGTKVGGRDGIAVVDPATRTVADFIPVTLGLPLAVAISGDGARLVVGTDRGFEVLDVATKTSRGGSAIGNVSKITRHPLRPLVYATVSSRGVCEIDPASGEVTRTFRGGIQSHAVSPDGTRLYTVALDSVLRVWNLESGAEEPRLTSVGGWDVDVTPDGKFLYVVGYESGGPRLSVVDPGSGALVRTVDTGADGRRIAMSRDGIAAVSTVDGRTGEGWIAFVR
ncbi:MAG TPA: Ig-like domain-containing protein [Gemmatimonadales bacterium]|nr:Ig-like domain-containing protein [Gemmatimonadales bacterium]